MCMEFCMYTMSLILKVESSFFRQSIHLLVTLTLVNFDIYSKELVFSFQSKLYYEELNTTIFSQFAHHLPKFQ